MNRIQVLVATMNQRDYYSKYTEMKLNTDTIFANQYDLSKYEKGLINGKCIEMITTTTRGVGINRNIALSYASGDIVVIADDDMKYVDNYAQIISKAFRRIPDADGFVFNISTHGKNVGRRKNKKIKRVHFYNALNYGAARLAVKRKSLIREGITFNTNFGGGCIYSAGEDVIFVTDMLKHGMKLYTYPETIGIVNQNSSTWFEGYTEKFFYDKGALYKKISGGLAFALCIYSIIMHPKIYKESNIPVRQIVRLMVLGMKGLEELESYDDFVKLKG